MLLPPQMRKPNVSTEDVESWTTRATMQKKREAERRQQEKLSFQQREKRKRDRGQSARGKSFVEGALSRLCRVSCGRPIGKLAAKRGVDTVADVLMAFVAVFPCACVGCT